MGRISLMYCNQRDISPKAIDYKFATTKKRLIPNFQALKNRL
jgi:hypothetical protein